MLYSTHTYCLQKIPRLQSQVSNRMAQTLVMSVLLFGGYFLWRGRYRYQSLETDFDFEKDKTTRHMVRRHSVSLYILPILTLESITGPFGSSN